MDCQGQRRATEGSQRTGVALDRLNTLRVPFDGSLMATDALVIAVLGPGRPGETSWQRWLACVSACSSSTAARSPSSRSSTG